MIRPPCPKCLPTGSGTEQLNKSIEELVRLLPPEKKTDEVTYNERLAVCGGCAELHAGMCGECGCFVLLRAAKKAMGCPVGKWEKYTGEK